MLVVHLPKTKKELKGLCKPEIQTFLYKNELDKACFQHDMAYGKSKDLAKITQSDKVLRDKGFKIASDPKYGGYQRGLASIIFLIKNPLRLIYLVEVISLMNQIINWQELLKPITRKLRKEKFIHLLETIFWVLI